MIIIIVINL